MKSTRARRAHLELAQLLEEEHLEVSLAGYAGGQFCHPGTRRDAPVEFCFGYPGRMIPGAVGLAAYRDAQKMLSKRRTGRRYRFPCGVLIYNPRGKGVREHIALIPLPTLIVLLREAGRIE